MTENLHVLSNEASKEEKYRNLTTQIDALLSAESDQIANLANVAAALKQTFRFFWVGFYLVISARNNKPKTTAFSRNAFRVEFAAMLFQQFFTDD